MRTQLEMSGQLPLAPVGSPEVCHSVPSVLGGEGGAGVPGTWDQGPRGCMGSCLPPPFPGVSGVTIHINCSGILSQLLLWGTDPHNLALSSSSPAWPLSGPLTPKHHWAPKHCCSGRGRPAFGRTCSCSLVVRLQAGAGRQSWRGGTLGGSSMPGPRCINCPEC